jgi:hypothetical protein
MSSNSKSKSNELYNTMTLVFVVLAIVIFLCALGMMVRVLPVPGFLQPRTPVIPTPDVLPTLTETPTFTPTFTETPTETPTRTVPPTRTRPPTLTPSS